MTQESWVNSWGVEKLVAGGGGCELWATMDVDLHLFQVLFRNFTEEITEVK
jgi:hypothetical protein